MRKPLLAAVALAAAVFAQGSPVEFVGAAPADDPGNNQSERAVEVHTASAADEHRIHPGVREQVDAGATGSIPVYVTVTDPTDAAALLDDPKIAFEDGAGIVVGRVDATLLPKLAGAPGV